MLVGPCEGDDGLGYGEGMVGQETCQWSVVNEDDECTIVKLTINSSKDVQEVSGTVTAFRKLKAGALGKNNEQLQTQDSKEDEQLLLSTIDPVTERYLHDLELARTHRQETAQAAVILISDTHLDIKRLRVLDSVAKSDILMSLKT